MLIDTIRADRLVAMKERDELKRDLLGTLFAAATKDSKTPDDATVVRSIRAFVKSLDETIAGEGHPGGLPAADHPARDPAGQHRRERGRPAGAAAEGDGPGHGGAQGPARRGRRHEAGERPREGGPGLSGRIPLAEWSLRGNVTHLGRNQK